MRVQFNVTQGAKGPQASNIVALARERRRPLRDLIGPAARKEPCKNQDIFR